MGHWSVGLDAIESRRAAEGFNQEETIKTVWAADRAVAATHPPAY
jgi:hypothetical protein